MATLNQTPHHTHHTTLRRVHDELLEQSAQRPSEQSATTGPTYSSGTRDATELLNRVERPVELRNLRRQGEQVLRLPELHQALPT